MREALVRWSLLVHQACIHPWGTQGHLGGHQIQVSLELLGSLKRSSKALPSADVALISAQPVACKLHVHVQQPGVLKTVTVRAVS